MRRSRRGRKLAAAVAAEDRGFSRSSARSGDHRGGSGPRAPDTDPQEGWLTHRSFTRWQRRQARIRLLWRTGRRPGAPRDPPCPTSGTVGDRNREDPTFAAPPGCDRAVQLVGQRSALTHLEDGKPLHLRSVSVRQRRPENRYPTARSGGVRDDLGVERTRANNVTLPAGNGRSAPRYAETEEVAATPVRMR